MIWGILRGGLGLAVLILLAWLMSYDRRRAPWRLVILAVVMQFVFALTLQNVKPIFAIFESVSESVAKLLGFANEGAIFVFGRIAAGPDNVPGLAFRALPTIIFFSCLMSVLYHLRVMHAVVWVLSQIMTRVLGVSGAESMSMAANVFVGQTEAPLFIRHFIPKMTQSELMSLMTGGFATVAGSVMAVYMGMVGPGYAPHLLIGSVMAAPAAFAFSKLILPETQESETGRGMTLRFTPAADNVLDAASRGTTDGLHLWLNVCAMLVAFTAMIALVDWPLQALGDRLNVDGGLSLQRLLGWILYPIAWVMGVETADCSRFGSLLGIKISLNEFMAYSRLETELGYRSDAAALAKAGFDHAISERTAFMATYALCGFANFASIGIQIGGISPLAPERRGDIIKLALRAMLAGALATMMTATIAGMFYR